MKISGLARCGGQAVKAEGWSGGDGLQLATEGENPLSSWMNLSADDLIRKLMEADGQSPGTTEAFLRARRILVSGETGCMPESTLEPASRLPRWEDLPPASEDGLTTAAVVKLNGGLGTGMGLEKAKSLIPVKDGASFLDLTRRQLAALGARAGQAPCFLLMNSFSTSGDTRAHLAAHPVSGAPEPLELLQSRVPKLDAAGALPAAWPAQPDLEWCPPGHGDLYPTLHQSGLIAALEARGIDTLFVSNSDNLGATLDPRILTWFRRQGLPFLMEVAERTPADRKGGHLARRRADGRLVLRESAQCLPEDETAFQDIGLHRFFNTNNLWISLPALKAALAEHGGFLPLPLIVNRKTVDPRDKASTPVVQLESAMGAAVEVFEGAQALVVPRARFAPVKTTADLLVVRSDAYVAGADGSLALAPECAGRVPQVKLDDTYFKLMADFDRRFPGGAPSLKRCRSLVVKGDWTFAPGVVLEGEVELNTRQPATLPAGTHSGPVGAGGC